MKPASANLGVVSTGLVRVLFVSVSVVALPTSVSVAAGRVIVTSAVEAGPINVAEFVPLSVSSLNKILPAELELPDRTGAVNVNVDPESKTVPVVSGNVIVLSAVGLVNVSVVS